MKTSLLNSSGSHRNAALEQYDRSTADLYTTPAEAVQRLYKACPDLLQRLAWDSSAGLGHIVRAIRDLGGRCIGTELHNHPFERVANITTGVDLFSRDVAPATLAIVNPPYKGADNHIRHMLDLGCEVYALLRYVYPCAKRRSWMLPHLRGIYMVGRQGMLPPGAEDKGMNPTIDYAWFHLTPTPKTDNTIILERA